jgi:hypothetical protein
MQDFLVEVYQPQSSRAEYRNAVKRLRAAARALTKEGTPVRYRRSLFLPTDETAFHILGGISRHAVTEAARRAAIDAARILDATQ